MSAAKYALVLLFAFALAFTLVFADTGGVIGLTIQPTCAITLSQNVTNVTNQSPNFYYSGSGSRYNFSFTVNNAGNVPLTLKLKGITNFDYGDGFSAFAVNYLNGSCTGIAGSGVLGTGESGNGTTICDSLNFSDSADTMTVNASYLIPSSIYQNNSANTSANLIILANSSNCSANQSISLAFNGDNLAPPPSAPVCAISLSPTSANVTNQSFGFYYSNASSYFNFSFTVNNAGNVPLTLKIKGITNFDSGDGFSAFAANYLNGSCTGLANTSVFGTGESGNGTAICDSLNFSDTANSITVNASYLVPISIYQNNSENTSANLMVAANSSNCSTNQSISIVFNGDNLAPPNISLEQNVQYYTRDIVQDTQNNTTTVSIVIRNGNDTDLPYFEVHEEIPENLTDNLSLVAFDPPVSRTDNGSIIAVWQVPKLGSGQAMAFVYTVGMLAPSPIPPQQYGNLWLAYYTPPAGSIQNSGGTPSLDVNVDAACSGQAGTISVADHLSGQPVNARVRLFTNIAGPVTQTIVPQSTGSGLWSFSPSSPGDYEISATQGGYLAFDGNFTVADCPAQSGSNYVCKNEGASCSNDFDCCSNICLPSGKCLAKSALSSLPLVSMTVEPDCILNPTTIVAKPTSTTVRVFRVDGNVQIPESSVHYLGNGKYTFKPDQLSEYVAIGTNPGYVRSELHFGIQECERKFTCTPNGFACSVDSKCCSNYCSPKGYCADQASLSSYSQLNGKCITTKDCRTGYCSSGKCITETTLAPVEANSNTVQQVTMWTALASLSFIAYNFGMREVLFPQLLALLPVAAAFVTNPIIGCVVAAAELLVASKPRLIESLRGFFKP